MTAQRIAIFVGFLVVLAAVWKLLHPVHTYRFRLTIEATKNGVTHAGSSVIELKTRRLLILSSLTEAPMWETSVRGEAVFVDLGNGDHVIALLTGPNETVKTAALPSRAILGDSEANMGPPGVLDTLSTFHPRLIQEAKGRSFQLRTGQIPPLIRFRDINNPKSVEAVENSPGEMTSVTGRLELTTDPVTQSIRQRLPWLELYKNLNLTGESAGTVWRAGEAPYSKPSHIDYRSFIGE